MNESTARKIPFDDREPGEECTECGQTIKPNPDARMCHSCRVRPHEAVVDQVTNEIMSATDDHPTRTSIALAVRKRLFVDQE